MMKSTLPGRMTFALLIAALLALAGPATLHAVTGIDGARIVGPQDSDIINDDDDTADPATRAFKPLFDQYTNLRRALQGQGGIAARDLPLITRIRDRVDAFLDQYPLHKPALAAAAQLSIWLKDNEAVFTYFEQLVRLDPENLQLAVDWESHFTALGDKALLDRVYDALMQLRPGDAGLAKRLAESAQSRGDHARTVSVLNAVELHPTRDARHLQVLATAYAGLNQFEEAVEALQRISEEALDDERLRGNVERELESWMSYIELWRKEQELLEQQASQDDLPRAEILTAKGPIIVELFEDHAPNTVANFVTLAESDFWLGTRFHRIEAGLIVQGGDPNSRPDDPRTAGTGHPGYYIPDEHTTEEARVHFTGSLAMAKRTAPNTAGCQFYFGLQPMPWLNGAHTVFGRVVEGMDIVRALEVNDEIVSVTILRKRDHSYEVETLPIEAPAVTIPPPGIDQ